MMTTQNFSALGVQTSIGGQSVGNFAVRWVSNKKPTKKKTLAALNKELFSNPSALLAWAEENTQRLTGQRRI